MAKQKILVIEDERPIAETIGYALETDGFEVLHRATAQGGLEAFLGALSGGEIALIILDVGLPDGNGFELCKKLREKAATPVIFLTARAEEVDRIVGLEIGADDYMAKPFSPRELVARVKAVLRRGTAKAKDAPGSTPFEVDEGRNRITFMGKPLELSRYEFRILQLLVRRPGHVYTREKLMELVWEDPGMSLERTVDAHIKTLRAKLKAISPDIEAIQTHRGVGYALKENW